MVTLSFVLFYMIFWIHILSDKATIMIKQMQQYQLSSKSHENYDKLGNFESLTIILSDR